MMETESGHNDKCPDEAEDIDGWRMKMDVRSMKRK